jgi:hypothetical protein
MSQNPATAIAAARAASIRSIHGMARAGAVGTVVEMDELEAEEVEVPVELDALEEAVEEVDWVLVELLAVVVEDELEAVVVTARNVAVRVSGPVTRADVIWAVLSPRAVLPVAEVHSTNV